MSRSCSWTIWHMFFRIWHYPIAIRRNNSRDFLPYIINYFVVSFLYERSKFWHHFTCLLNSILYSWFLVTSSFIFSFLSIYFLNPLTRGSMYSSLHFFIKVTLLYSTRMHWRLSMIAISWLKFINTRFLLRILAVTLYLFFIIKFVFKCFLLSISLRFNLTYVVIIV